jgi:peptidoglycan hydrolase-like protein with peptidoglycan-binding domain
MRASVVAPLVAALVGVVAGTTTALVTVESATEKEDPPAQVVDPLGLGIPMVRLECDPRKGVLVLGFGDTSAALQAAKSDNPEGDPSYVDTAESCDTIYGPERRVDPPRYAVILGPFDDLEEPCRLRMDPVRRGDFVTALRSGNQMTVKCVCVLPDSADRPDLEPGMNATDADRVWVRSLQGMFNDKLGEEFPNGWVTGDYDERTAARVRAYQETSTVDSEPGVVDDETWRLLKTRLCGDYEW